jgi:hypothetical protein
MPARGDVHARERAIVLLSLVLADPLSPTARILSRRRAAGPLSLGLRELSFGGVI